jgi:glycoside/pentoside/hexuronide:cation symporter, GPH family
LKTAPKLTFNTKFAYGIGQLAEGLKNASLGTFVLFYYNQVLGLSGTLAGLAVAIALIFDAFTDPLAGSISDNWHSSMGRRHPFMYASAIPLAIAFYFLFAPPSGFSETGLFVWLTVTLVLTRGAMTLYHVPHIALGAELSEDYEERTQVVSFRYFLSFVGWLLAYFAGFGWFFRDTPEFPSGQFNTEAYAPFALLMSCGMLLTIFWSAWGTRHRIPYLPPVTGAKQPMTVVPVFTRMFSEILGALGNKSFLWLFLGALLIFVMVGVDSALNLYMFEYFWELDSSEKLVLMLLYPVGIMTGTLLTPLLHRRVDKVWGIFIGVTWWSLCQIGPVLLRFIGWFPDNDADLLPLTLTVIKFTQGLAAAQSLVSFNSMIADIADEHELTSGKRQEGIFFAAASFSTKTTSGLGSFVAGIGLDFISWPRGAHIQSAADIPTETLASLGMLYGPIVAGFAVFSILFSAQCKMTRQKHAAVVADLAKIRSS